MHKEEKKSQQQNTTLNHYIVTGSVHLIHVNIIINNKLIYLAGTLKIKFT